MSDLKKPGMVNQKPGKYIEIGPRSGQLKNPREVTIDKGDYDSP